jgi:hypothetical protein
VASPAEVGSINFRVIGSTKFEHGTMQMSGLPTSNPAVTDRVFDDRSTLRLVNDYSPITYYHNHQEGSNVGSQGTTANWFQLPSKKDVVVYCGMTGGYGHTYRYLYRLPLVCEAGQRIRIYNGALYVAISQLTNGGASGTTNFYARTGTGAPTGGVAGSLALKVEEGYCEIIAQERSGGFFWFGTNGTFVNRTTL